MNVLNITLVIVIYSPEALAALGSTGVMVGDLHLTCLNNFCVHLLVGCNGLEKNACRFLVRDSSATSGDCSCKLCGADCEDTQHFISSFSLSFSLHTLVV